MGLLTVDEPIAQEAEWDTAVYGATKMLEELVRDSRPRLAAVDWSLVWIKGNSPRFHLRVADEMGRAAEARFTWEELQDGGRLRGRLNRLWGDVLFASLRFADFNQVLEKTDRRRWALWLAFFGSLLTLLVNVLLLLLGRK